MDRRLDRDWERDIVPYPDPAIETLEPRFRELILGNAALERLYTGSRWAEGPVWFGDGRYLLWSDIPNNRILRWSEETGAVSVFREPSQNSNGNTRDRQGRLVTCEHDARRVTRTEYDGSVTVVLDAFEGKRLNAPNDVVVQSEGSVWFSDPGYGILGNYEGTKSAFELPTRVYRLEPDTDAVSVVVEELERPNGLCFSPDETKLYVTDTGSSPARIMVYDVVEGKRVENGVPFCDLGTASADGIRCDTAGNLWSSASGPNEGDNGVHVFDPSGTLIGKIHLPERVSNLTFGGVKRNRLFITASQSLYALYVEAQGAQTP
jgi:gluconolactonase